MSPHSTWSLTSAYSHCFVSTYVCVLVHLTAAASPRDLSRSKTLVMQSTY